jgi:integrase
MLDTGLLKNEDGQNRTLYSLRHTYATFELLRGGTDMHTLSKQMGTSVKMIEQHYGHLKPAQKADVIAGKSVTGAKRGCPAKR